MSTQLYLMGGLVEGRLPSDRDLRQLRVVRNNRRAERSAHRARRRHARR